MNRPRLITQILTVNLFMVTAALFVAALTSGIDLSSQRGRWQFAVLAGAWLGTFFLNGFLLRRRFEPLDRLLDVMEHADLSKPGRRFDLDAKLAGSSIDLERLAASFNRMLDRLERERLRSGERALRAQEEERKRVARDLHDEVNQALTALLLRIEAAIQNAPADLVAELRETKQLANQAMEELLDLARQLRPTALDDHGLVAALRANARELGRRIPVRVDFWADPDLEELPAEVQVVVYRVAQEAMNNAARHAHAGQIDVSLGSSESCVHLRVADNGSGFTVADEDQGQGLGLSGMRERALLVGGTLTIDSRPGRGTTVVLEVPTDSKPELQRELQNDGTEPTQPMQEPMRKPRSLPT
ncbi:MAG: sensor histidine kinase [Solirubrobacterales bacterium]